MTIGAQILVQTDNGFVPLAGELADAITEIRVEQHLDERTSFAIRFQEDYGGGTTITAGHTHLARHRGIAILVPESTGATRLVCLVRGQIEQSDFDIAIGGSGSWYEVRGQDIRTTLDRAVGPREHLGTGSEILRSLLQGISDGDDEIDSSVLEYSEDADVFRYRGSQLEGIEELARICNVSFWLTYTVESLQQLWRIRPHVHLVPSPRAAANAGAGPSAPLEQLAVVPEKAPRLVILGGNEPETVVNFRVATDYETITRAEYATLDYEGNPTDPASVTESNTDQTNRGGRGPADGDDPNVNTFTTASVGQPSASRKIAEAAVTEGQWFISADTLTSVYMLGAVLQPHDLVRVVGAGCHVAGVYQVRDVTHVIHATEHWMQVDLRTNTLPKEPGHA